MTVFYINERRARYGGCATATKTVTAAGPISAVVLGSGKALDHMELLKEVTIA